MNADLPRVPPALTRRYEEAKAKADAALDALAAENKNARAAVERLRKKTEASRIMKAATPPKGTKTT